MGAASFFRSRGFTSVAGRTYPDTFAVVPKSSFLAEQVANRDSASWKKAEHIVVEQIQADAGVSMLHGWKMLTQNEPVGLSIQKLYVAISYNQYALYDASGVHLKNGTLSELV